MGTDINVRPTPNMGTLSSDQVDLIKRTIADGATDDELALFVGLANRTGLDPFSKQIFLVPRRVNKNGTWIETRQAMVSIDGARLVAQRSGKFRGETAPEWCGDDGVWVEAWLKHEPPAAARVGVFHADYPERATYGVARYWSYVQVVGKDGAPNATWARMPDVMLAKCAEMLALRKAFQQDLGGLLIEEESGTDPVVIDTLTTQVAGIPPLPDPIVGRAERKRIDEAREAASLTASEVRDVMQRMFNVRNSQMLRMSQVEPLIAEIQAKGMNDIPEDVPDAQTELLGDDAA